MNNKRGDHRASIGLLALATTCSLAQAQSSATPVASENAITEIIVTARRQEESSQSVPVTVRSYDAEMLREANIFSATDLMKTTPGISTVGSGAPANALYVFRGLGRQITGNNQPGVVSYFAEVPLPNAASNMPLFDMANVQVLKGPQGTLFGRNTVGGAVLLSPQTPDYNFGGYVQARAGNYSSYGTEAALNLPLMADKLALRVAGLTDDRDGYTKNLGAGGDLDDLKLRAGRVSLLWEPISGLRNTLIVDYAKTNSTSGSIALSGGTLPLPPGLAGPLAAAVAQAQALGPRTTDTGSLVPDEEITRSGVTNRTELDLGSNFSMTNIFGYRNADYDSQNNLDGLRTGTVDGVRGFQYHQYSDELQFRGAFADGKVNGLVGVFYLKSEPSGNNVNDTTVIFDRPATFAYLDDESRAVFANISWDLGDWVSGVRLSAGYRYTWDEQEACTAAGLLSTQPGYVPSVDGLPYAIDQDDCKVGTPGLVNVGTATSESSAPGWTFGVDWQATDEIFVYAVTRQGYRAGGVNAPTLGAGLTSFQSFEPETNTDVELGVKTDWSLGDVVGRLNVAAFYSKQEDVQIVYTGLTDRCVPGVSVFIDGDCDRSNDPASDALMVNSGDTSIRGIETELIVKPISSLTLSVMFSYLDPKIDDPIVPAEPLGSAAAATTGGVINFNQFLHQNVAERTLSAAVRWQVPIPDNIGDLVFNADYYRSSEIPINALIVPSYDETNARLDLNNVAGLPLDLGVFVTNVFDDDNIVGAGFSPVLLTQLVVSAQYNAPRMYGAQLRYRFGGSQ